MSEPDDTRSRWPCPACGEHRVATEELPHVDVLGYQPYAEIIGMGEQRVRETPGIVCLACGRRWPDADAFFADPGGAPTA